MKKILAMLGVFVLTIVLVGCGSSGDTDPVKTLDINAGLEDFQFDEIDENINTNISVLTGEEKEVAKSNDELRTETVKKIQTALELFAANNASYPETYDELVPDYLEVWPDDPGSYEYVYTPIGALPARFYDVSYQLELDTDELSAGVNIASPDEIFK